MRLAGEEGREADTRVRFCRFAVLKTIGTVNLLGGGVIVSIMSLHEMILLPSGVNREKGEGLGLVAYMTTCLEGPKMMLAW